ncbi:hypothetical protein CNBI3590 [Cryptococcus deneoformans B-3501A]|uniref:Macrofage activating glycoprotein n=1 Tax=Cryptococcus deneoformans (strain JEC21 / ATCC MYA-565) TaxID=214684 RepID=Q5KD42_CRYD1|nr:conserved hypothetical protein [Cryptococcus neoformans var. neoformans JEC21]XP_773306.1 hypothetical protein CNBI3590 [Cryptococcus neoformans var. neoformans B-3501A]AAW45184.1 conserved hypothetical protein [Cryptococcus neoformans var. neoformans JEC21]EAL18659.1 hypothetical protein CNBI3590 [Cryptococcus neoformans var. neoformans B-3501A]
MSSLHHLVPLLFLIAPALSQYTATYSPYSLPETTEQGQYGTNACGTSSSQDSKCQNVYVNGVDDFCLWGPPETTSNEGDGTSKIGNVEQIVVSYCLKDGYGTRLIPPGSITGAHFVKVLSEKVSYVQVTGVGDLTKLLIPAGDDGGELDPHSWTGLGNPQGGLVFTNAFTGSYEQTHEWTSFMSADEFCIRACRDGDNAAAYCQHIYDVLSCSFTIPGDMSPGFDSCLGEPTEEAPGVYSGSTFRQGDPTTPAPHPAGATSECQVYSSVGGGNANIGQGAVVSAATTTRSSSSAEETNSPSSISAIDSTTSYTSYTSPSNTTVFASATSTLSNLSTVATTTTIITSASSSSVPSFSSTSSSSSNAATTTALNNAQSNGYPKAIEGMGIASVCIAGMFAFSFFI